MMESWDPFGTSQDRPDVTSDIVTKSFSQDAFSLEVNQGPPKPSRTSSVSNGVNADQTTNQTLDSWDPFGVSQDPAMTVDSVDPVTVNSFSQETSTYQSGENASNNDKNAELSGTNIGTENDKTSNPVVSEMISKSLQENKKVIFFLTACKLV